MNILSETPLVTVIMPVYNTELYVADAIESVLNQTLDALELICIDDGSSDCSREICEAFEANDERVTVIAQPNSGQGCARNKALKMANGRYIYFMDSDDILAPTALEEVCGEMNAKKADLIFFEAHCFGDVKEANRYKRSSAYEEVYAGPDLASLLLDNNDFIVSPCLYVATTDLYRDSDIRFLERVKHEDDIVTILVLLNSKRAACINRDLYARRYRVGSTMTSFDPEASTKGAFKTYCELLRRRSTADGDSVLRSTAGDMFLQRCKNETIRFFSHASASPDQFADVVDCGDGIELQAADEIVRSISKIKAKFYLARGLRHLKRELSKGLRC